MVYSKMNIFVFGSNLAGRHGKGAAQTAYDHHGAIYGQGRGLQGRSYAIPTKDKSLKTRSLPMIQKDVEVFLAFARSYAGATFQVTAIGCGLAGYHPQDIAPMFEGAPDNCVLPNEFNEVYDDE